MKTKILVLLLVVVTCVSALIIGKMQWDKGANNINEYNFFCLNGKANMDYLIGPLQGLILDDDSSLLKEDILYAKIFVFVADHFFSDSIFLVNQNIRYRGGSGLLVIRDLIDTYLADEKITQEEKNKLSIVIHELQSIRRLFNNQLEVNLSNMMSLDRKYMEFGKAFDNFDLMYKKLKE